MSYNRKAGFSFGILTIIGSFVYTFVMAQKKGYHQIAHLTDFATWGEYMADIYIKPWSRCPPYIYGLLIGVPFVDFLNYEKTIKNPDTKERPKKPIMAAMKEKFQKSRPFRYAFELIGVAIMLFLILIPRTLQINGSNSWDQVYHSAYLTFAKGIFCFGLSMFLLPSLLGINSYVRFILDTNFFSVIAKISFCTYLVHLMVILWHVFTYEVDYYFTQDTQWSIFAFYLLASSIIGFLMTIIVEVPFSKIERHGINLLKNKLMP